MSRCLLIAASVLVSLLLASCISHTGTVPYPASWAPIRQGQAGGSCPKMDGVYQDNGESEQSASGRPCTYENGECASLIFGLLGDAHVLGTDREFARGGVQRVQIEQPSPGVVEIIAEPGEKRQSLSMANGDFTCDGVGLRLRDKTSTTIFLISNIFVTESRIFNVADDGSLMMKSMWHNQGNHTFFPFSVTNEELVRWTRVSPTEKSNVGQEQGDAQPGPIPTPGDPVINCAVNGKRQWTNLSKCE